MTQSTSNDTRSPTHANSTAANAAQRTLLSQLAIECPPKLLARASTLPRIRVGIVNATTPTVLQSAQAAFELGLIEPLLIGPPNEIQSGCAAIEWDASQHDIETAGDAEEAAAVAASMNATGGVDAIMKGDIKSDVLLRTVLRSHTKARTHETISHIFQMTIPGCDQALFITDAVLNVQPSLEQKIEIAKNAVSLLKSLGYKEPRIALLSASESESPAVPSSQDAAEIARRARSGKFPGAVVDGPLALDVAVSSTAAGIKGLEGEIVGNADCLLVPNIETGNALFKMMVHMMSAAAAGIVLGAKVPIALTSRADPVAARVASLALAKIYVHRKNR